MQREISLIRWLSFITIWLVANAPFAIADELTVNDSDSSAKPPTTSRAKGELEPMLAPLPDETNTRYAQPLTKWLQPSEQINDRKSKTRHRKTVILSGDIEENELYIEWDNWRNKLVHH